MAAVDLLFNWIQTFYLIIFWGWPFILLMIIIFFKIRWKSWPVEVIIIEKRGNNLIKTNDRAGKYIDPYSNLTGYRLQKSKENIPIVNYEWVMHNVCKYTTFLDRIVHLLRGDIGTLFLFKYGAKQYKPIWITQNSERKKILREIKDANGNPILIQVYEQFDPRRHLGALDFQVIDWDNMNFLTQEQRASFERRQKKKDFMKQVLIPIAGFVVSALVCIIMIKFSYDYAMSMKGSIPPSPATTPNIPIVSDIIPPAG